MDVSGQIYTPAVSPLEEEPRYPLKRGLGGPRGRSGRISERRALPLCGTESWLVSWRARGIVTTLTELPHLDRDIITCYIGLWLLPFKATELSVTFSSWQPRQVV